MAAIVFNGFQSRMESQLAESRLHKLIRLPSPKPLTPPQPIDLPFKSCFWETKTEENNLKTENFHHNTMPSIANTNQCAFSSIQSLSPVSRGPKEPTYVHPQVKKSSLRLSLRSLELCTENLGNETGSDDVTDIDIDMLCFGTGEQSKKPRQVLETKKVKPQNFPPPLTTMRGSESLRVRPHREGGRLVIEVTKVPLSASCFQAERSHGRLRLCFWTDPEDDENDEFEEDFETELNGGKHEEDEEVEEDAENENIDNSWSIGGDIRMEKYERSRGRCKEGDHENNELLVNWGEPLRVALALATS
ncbi:protein FANTASTIC FOUR 3 [Lotus japonicus]|uniref:protein FANTASTIC FOUR 3 n=1 Tax=Lotus japonicus TaxID=34305 RepID=UPI00258E55BC|nr:protein FANTASTIC FOUR 3 [Lotus japonicus]